MPETCSPNRYTTATLTSRSFWLVLMKDGDADTEPTCWGHPEKGRGKWDPLQPRKPGEGDEVWEGDGGALRGPW